MEKKLRELKNRFFSELKTVRDDDFLAELKIKYLGRKGELASILRGVKDLAVEEKPRVGQLANEIKKELLEVFGRTEAIIKKSAIRPRNFDSSLPGQRREIGHLHPSTIVQEEIEEAFAKLGFSIFDGPQLESDYYNFTALIFPRIIQLEIPRTLFG